MDTTNRQQNSISNRLLNKAHFELQFEVEHASTLIDVLAQQTGLSKQQLKGALAKGCVWFKAKGKTQKVTRVRRVKKEVTPGDEISIYYDEAVLNASLPEPKLIDDCHDFSVWYKPKGLLSQGSKWGDHSTIARWVEMHPLFNGKQRQALVVHRLDRATDGLILLAHTHQAAKLLTEAFMGRKTTKIYQVGVWGAFPETEQTYSQPIEGRAAISHAKRLDYNPDKNISLLEVHIETGRKHQIRRHLSGAGFPIVGDRLHGDAKLNATLPALDMMLTAVFLHLGFEDKPYEFTLPADLNQTLNDFRTL